jgi:hypothetical protein
MNLQCCNSDSRIYNKYKQKAVPFTAGVCNCMDRAYKHLWRSYAETSSWFSVCSVNNCKKL